MIKKLNLLLVALMLAMFAASGSAYAQEDAQQIPPLPIDKDVKIGKLPNGLTYFIRHNVQPKGRANFYIAQRVGAMQEQDNQAGLAHFLEHMAFNGTKNFEDKELINYLESIGVAFGAELNAYTAFDETMYTIKDAPVSNGNGVVDSCLMILRDWSDGIALLDEEIDNERGVIENEWRQGDSGSMRAFTQLLKEMFPGLNYGKRMPIGDINVIRNFTYQELRDYYHKWYRPDLQGLIIVGDVNVDYVENKIKEIFKDVPAPVNPAERIYEQIPDREAPVSIVVTDPELQGTQVSFAFTGDALSPELKASAMGMSMDYIYAAVQHMFQARMKEMTQKPDAPFIQGYLSVGPLLGLTLTEDAFDFSAVAHEGRYLDALNAMVAEMKRVRDFGFTAAEYDRARTEILSDYENRMNSIENRTNTQYAMEYGKYFTTGGYIPGVAAEYALMSNIAPNISVEAVNQFVAQALQSKNFIIYLMAVEKEGLKYPTKEELLEQYNKALEQEVEAYVDEFAGVPLIADDALPKAGETLSIEKNLKHGVTRLALSNGAKVYLLPTTYKKNDIRLVAHSYGGYDKTDMCHVGKRALSGDYALVGGVGEFDQTALNKVLAGTNVSLDLSVSEFREKISAASTNKDLETMFQLLYLRMTQNRSDKEAFKAAIQKEKAMIEAGMSNPMMTVYRDSIPELLRPGDKLQRPLSPEELDAIDYDTLFKTFNQRFEDASDFTFFIVGSFDIETITPLVERYIGGLPSTYSKEADNSSNAARMNSKDTTNHFFIDADTPTAFVLDVLVNDGEYDLASDLKMSILGDVLSQQYFKSIREDEGGTYGVSAQGSLSRAPKGEEMVLIIFQTDPESTDKLNGKIKDELKKIAAGEIDVTEYFNKTVLNYQKKYDQNLEENSYWTNVIVDEFFFNNDFHTNYLETLKSISVKDIEQYLGKILKDGRYLELVAKTKKTAAEAKAEGAGK